MTFMVCATALFSCSGAVVRPALAVQMRATDKVDTGTATALSSLLGDFPSISHVSLAGDVGRGKFVDNEDKEDEAMLEAALTAKASRKRRDSDTAEVKVKASKLLEKSEHSSRSDKKLQSTKASTLKNKTDHSSGSDNKLQSTKDSDRKYDANVSALYPFVSVSKSHKLESSRRIGRATNSSGPSSRNTFFASTTDPAETIAVSQKLSQVEAIPEAMDAQPSTSMVSVAGSAQAEAIAKVIDVKPSSTGSQAPPTQSEVDKPLSLNLDAFLGDDALLDPDAITTQSAPEDEGRVIAETQTTPELPVLEDESDVAVGLVLEDESDGAAVDVVAGDETPITMVPDAAVIEVPNPATVAMVAEAVGTTKAASTVAANDAESQPLLSAESEEAAIGVTTTGGGAMTTSLNGSNYLDNWLMNSKSTARATSSIVALVVARSLCF